MAETTTWEANGNAVHKRISPHYATCICVCEGEDRHVNARLFAAAPELLRVLTELVELKDTKPHDYEQRKPLAWAQARLAIKSATGTAP